jgi:hypothetical protein
MKRKETIPVTEWPLAGAVSRSGTSVYSSFGIGVDRKRALKRLFNQEEATL